MGYLPTMFPFSPPVENNMPPAVEEISDRVGAQNNRLSQVRVHKVYKTNVNNIMIHIHLL